MQRLHCPSMIMILLQAVSQAYQAVRDIYKPVSMQTEHPRTYMACKSARPQGRHWRSNRHQHHER